MDKDKKVKLQPLKFASMEKKEDNKNQNNIQFYEDRNNTFIHSSSDKNATENSITNNNENDIKKNESQSDKETKSFSLNKKIVGTIIGILLLAGVIVLIVLLCIKFFKNDNNDNDDENSDTSENEDPNILETSTPINPIQKDPNHIDSEFAFQMNVKDLNFVLVEQNYTETVLRNGNETIFNLIR